MDELRFCPNYDCPYRQRHGRAAEYSAETERCSDCGASLRGGTAATVKEAADADLGAPIAEPLALRPPPIGFLRPALVITAGILVALFYWLYLGIAVIASGAAMLRQWRRHAPRILPHERGFVMVVGDERVAYPSARLESAQVSTRELRWLGVKLGLQHDLMLTSGGKRRLFTGFSGDGSSPWLDFVRALSARSSLR